MSEQIEFHIDRVQKRLEKLVGVIDNDVKTGKEARELQDFVQDEMLPVMTLIAQDIRTLAEVVMEHDESIAELGPDTSFTQIQPEHAKEIIDHIEACNDLLGQLVTNAKKSGLDVASIEQRIVVGRGVIDFVKSVTVEEENDDAADDDEDVDDGDGKP